MSVHRPTYELCKEVCGNLNRPGFALDVEMFVDYSEMETTIDQSRIEKEIESMNLAKKSILHVGIGNSKFAKRFAIELDIIDGLTVSPNEKSKADSLRIHNYTIYLLNKYSREFISTISNKYDFIIDNNLASFACCKYHFYLMLDNYLWSLKPNGKILTDQRGMNWSINDRGWILTYADLVGLEDKFPVKVSQITPVVYAIEAIERGRSFREDLCVYTINTPNGTGPLERRLIAT
jgi:hypothetical protein